MNGLLRKYLAYAIGLDHVGYCVTLHRLQYETKSYKMAEKKLLCWQQLPYAFYVL